MTQNRETLLALADRCEKATGPDWELDAAIKEEFGHNWDYAADWGPRGKERPVAKPYTASLDAAMTLVPEGDYDFDLAKTSRGGDMFKLWQCRINLETVEQDPDETSPVALGEAHTPALALSAAALRARATLDPTEEKA